MRVRGLPTEKRGYGPRATRKHEADRTRRRHDLAEIVNALDEGYDECLGPEWPDEWLLLEWELGPVAHTFDKCCARWPECECP